MSKTHNIKPGQEVNGNACGRFVVVKLTQVGTVEAAEVRQIGPKGQLGTAFIMPLDAFKEFSQEGREELLTAYREIASKAISYCRRAAIYGLLSQDVKSNRSNRRRNIKKALACREAARVLRAATTGLTRRR